MEIMERLVKIKIFIILTLVIFINGITQAQHQIDKDVTFSLKGENGFAKLNPFLANINFDNSDLAFTDFDNCENVSGMFKFQVTPKGKIASIDVDGNLPSELVEAIKKRILLTENKWIFSEAVIKKDNNIEFYYPIYIQKSKKCNFKIHESYDLLKKLFKKHEVLSIDSDIYYIEPMLVYATIE
jgi:hypothetical protein